MRKRQSKYLLRCMYLNQTSMGIYLLLIGACIAPLIAFICGASWRMAFAAETVVGIVILLYCLGMTIEDGAYPAPGRGSGMDLGFFPCPSLDRSSFCWQSPLPISGKKDKRLPQNQPENQ